MARALRQETQKEYEAHVLVDNVRALLLVAEQAQERGKLGGEFDFTARVDLMGGINAGKAALMVVGLMKAAVVDEAKTAAEAYIPSYCESCIRTEISQMDYGNLVPSFRVVGPDVCDRCFGEPEST